jgi:hypothetical protein
MWCLDINIGSWCLWRRMVGHLLRRRGNGGLLCGMIGHWIRLPLLRLTLEGLWLPHRARPGRWSTVWSCWDALRGTKTLLLRWAGRAHTVRRGRGIGGVMVVVVVFAVFFLMMLAISALWAMLLHILLAVFAELVQDIARCHELEST